MTEEKSSNLEEVQEIFFQQYRNFHYSVDENKFESMIKANDDVKKRNEKERNRVRCLNESFNKLRRIVPSLNNGRKRRISKVKTIHKTLEYIKQLQSQLNAINKCETRDTSRR